jgi:uncharacterized protein YjiS (DUF1127 family)
MSNIDFSNIQDPIARAEAMRAQAIAEMFVDAIEGLRSLVKGAVAKVSAYLEFRRTYDVLSGMTDRELDDIGITRGDIADVARGIDPRPQAQARVPGDALAQHLALASIYDQEAPATAERANDDRPAVAA